MLYVPHCYALGKVVGIYLLVYMQSLCAYGSSNILVIISVDFCTSAKLGDNWCADFGMSCFGQCRSLWNTQSKVCCSKKLTSNICVVPWVSFSLAPMICYGVRSCSPSVYRTWILYWLDLLRNLLCKNCCAICRILKLDSIARNYVCSDFILKLGGDFILPYDSQVRQQWLVCG